MDLNLSKVSSELLLLLGSQVLIAEEDDAPLRNEESKLISLLICQVLELKSLDLCANVRSEIGNLRGCCQKGLFLLISPGAWIYIGALLVANLVHIVQIQGPRRPVWISVTKINSGFLEAGQRGLRQAQRVLDGFSNINDVRDNWSRRHG